MGYNEKLELLLDAAKACGVTVLRVDITNDSAIVEAEDGTPVSLQFIDGMWL